VLNGSKAGDTVITADFDGQTVSGETTCNSYNAPYTTRGRRMTIDSAIATTLRACAPGPTAAERAYLSKLPDVNRFAIDGRRLSLSRGNRVLLRYHAPVPAKAIVGRWRVTSYYTGTAVQSVSGGATLTANFSRRDVSGDGGCNAFSGPYETTGTQIRIGPLAATLRLCGNATLDDQETNYFAALDLATSFRVSGTRLDLFRADGGIAVELQASK
jgi:heat shock protein HslJ